MKRLTQISDPEKAIDPSLTRNVTEDHRKNPIFTELSEADIERVAGAGCWDEGLQLYHYCYPCPY